MHSLEGIVGKVFFVLGAKIVLVVTGRNAKYNRDKRGFSGSLGHERLKLKKGENAMRRRGKYRITIHAQPLTCLLCQHDIFTHRRIYPALTDPFILKNQEVRLALEQLCCVHCGEIRLFQEQSDTHMHYEEVQGK